MVRILLILLVVSAAAYSQDTAVKPKMYGTVYTTHSSTGGAYRIDEPLPQPAGFITLYVVQLDDDLKPPVIVDSILTDENGHFGIRLPAGKYGFIAIRDKNHPAPGQWLPQSSEANGFADGQTTDWWEISTGGPINLLSGDITGIVLTHHFRTHCYTCP